MQALTYPLQLRVAGICLLEAPELAYAAAMTGRTAITIDDVARRAGVSTATVSRFFNNPSLVATATADRIRTAVDAIGYVPNLLAGSLASSRSGLVAILVPVIVHSVFNDMVEAIVEELAQHGMGTMLGLTGADFEQLPLLVEAALGRRADGIILTGPVDDQKVLRRLEQQRTTVIETWGLPERPIQHAVGFSHLAVGKAVALFLRERGYQRPHLIVAEGSRARERATGFALEWKAGGGEAPTQSSVPIPSRFGHGRAAFKRLAGIDPQPDVVVCGSDWLAQGLIMEALHAGKNVPDELAVFGFGNFSVAGEMRPSISTVEIDGGRIGREAVRLLNCAGRRDAPNVVIDVGFRIVGRESA